MNRPSHLANQIAKVQTRLMGDPDTVVILARPGNDWTSSQDVLSERYAYRAFLTGSASDALTTMAPVHVDSAIDETNKGENIGLDFLTGTRNGRPTDLVLDQIGATARYDNAPGIGATVATRWPHAIAIEKSRIPVAHSGNYRIMAWSSMPNADGPSWSFVLEQSGFDGNDHRAKYPPNQRPLDMPCGFVVHEGVMHCAVTANSQPLGYPFDALAMDVAAWRSAAQPGFSGRRDNRWRFATRDSGCWPLALAASGTAIAVADTGNYPSCCGRPSYEHVARHGLNRNRAQR